jgi:tetratricopeptide (TPR) repeat protein
MNISNQVVQLLARAEAHAHSREWREAVQLSMQALALDNDNADVLDKLGWYLSCAKQHRQAIKVYTALVDRGPERALWPYMLGYQYYALGEWRQALTWFDHALTLHTTYLVALYRKGYAHMQLKETEPARQSFMACIAGWRELDAQEQIQHAKHYAGACFQLGKLELDRGRTRIAEHWLKEAVAHDARDVYKQYNLGKALLSNEKYALALEHLEQADHLKPRQDWLAVPLARAYEGLGRLSDAEVVLCRVPARRRAAYIWTELGKVLLAQNRATDAREAMQSAVRADDTNHNTFFVLAQAYESCDDTEAATKAYQRAILLRRTNYGVSFPQAEERLAHLTNQLPAT